MARQRRRGRGQERPTLLLLLLLLASSAALAFLVPSSSPLTPRWHRHHHHRRSRSPTTTTTTMMSEPVVAVGKGRFHPAWGPSSSSPQQQEGQQPPPAAQATAVSRFRRPPPQSGGPPKTRPGPQTPSQLRIVLTGFGPFRGVESNPSEALARRLGAAVTAAAEEEESEEEEERRGHSPPRPRRPPPAGAGGGPFVLSSSVVETSVVGAVEGLGSIQAGLAAEGLGADDNLLFVHLGVRNDIEGFHLESVGYNEADFSVPDERDFQPRGQAVSPTDGDTSRLLFSTLPLQSILRSLHRQQGYSRTQVAISTDPGRFCCNYIFYRSLEFCRARGPNTAALFVHLPPFSRVDPDSQFAFLHHLLATAAAHFPHVGQTPGLLA